MKHIREYEEGLLKDTQDLGLADKLYGWWVCIMENYDEATPKYFSIWEKKEHAAVIEFSIEAGFISNDTELEDSGLDKVKTFKGLENWYREGFAVPANFYYWEMEPTSTYLKDAKCERVPTKFPFNPAELLKIGNKDFKNFSQVINKSPLGVGR